MPYFKNKYDKDIEVYYGGSVNKENVKDATYGVPVFTVGNGWADNNRSNAIEVYRNLTKIKNNVKLETGSNIVFTN